MTDYLCNSDYFYRNNLEDHWFGETRNHRKKLVAWSHVSPSQIENFVKCKRNWHFKSIIKVPEIQRGPQALGESFHLILEKVGKGLPWPNRADTIATPEEWDKADQMAKIALPLLPQERPDRPGISIKREHGIRLATYENGPVMVGYVDLGVPPGLGAPALLVPDNEAIVADYKTTSDFRYMKTPEELASSVQMMTYAKWAIEEWPSGLCGEKDPSPEFIRLLHIYAKTKPPFDRRCIRHESAIVTPKEINSFWNKTLDIVREMQDIAESQCKTEDLEATGALNGHCEAYGGCSFRDKCGINKDSGIKGLFQIKTKSTVQETPNMSGSELLKKIQEARAKASGVTVTPVDPTPKTDVQSLPQETQVAKTTGPISTKGPVGALLAKIEQQGKGRPSLAGSAAAAYGKEIGSPTSQAFAGTETLGSTTVNNIGELLKLAEGIIPPDAAPREQSVITKPGDPVRTTDGLEVATEGDDDEDTGTEQSGNDSADSVVSPILSVSVPSGTALEPTKKRGRPSREEMALREAADRAKFDAAVRAEAEKIVGQPSLDTDLLQNQLHEALTQLDHAKNNHANSLDRIKQLEQAIKENHKNTGYTPVTQGCTLYIDCYPTKGLDRSNLVDFFEWIQPIASTVAEANGVKDYRLIQYTAKGLLASAMRELIKAEGLPNAMSLSTYASGADVALEILIPLAKHVIKKI